MRYLFNIFVHVIDFLLEVFAQFRPFGLHRRRQQVVLHGELFRMQIDVLRLDKDSRVNTSRQARRHTYHFEPFQSVGFLQLFHIVEYQLFDLLLLAQFGQTTGHLLFTSVFLQDISIGNNNRHGEALRQQRPMKRAVRHPLSLPCIRYRRRRLARCTCYECRCSRYVRVQRIRPRTTAVSARDSMGEAVASYLS